MHVVGEDDVIVKDNCEFVYQVFIIDLKDENIEKLEENGVKTEKSEKKEELQAENLKFYPNPNNGLFQLNFTLAEKGKTTIKIFDINGVAVYSEVLRNFTGTYTKEIDLTKEIPGIYFLQILQNKKIITKEIVIVK